MTLTIFALRQSAQPPRLEMPTPQRSDRVSLMQPKPSHPAPSPMTLGSRQNRASPAHNKPCQKWTLTPLPETGSLVTASSSGESGELPTRVGYQARKKHGQRPTPRADLRSCHHFDARPARDRRVRSVLK